MLIFGTALLGRVTTPPPTDAGRPAGPALASGPLASARNAPSPDSASRDDRGAAPTPPAKPGCVSVNAVPFAKVYVDGRAVGETPQACVRVAQGPHRLRFEWGSEQSPDYLVTVAKHHTADNPLRASYDFRAGRFVSRTD